MPIKALNPMAPFWYQPEREDNQGEGATRFKLRGMTGEEFAFVFPDWETDDAGRLTKPRGPAVHFIISNCLLGWENLSNSEGAIAFSKSNALKWLPFDVMISIVGEVMRASQLGDDEKKD